MGVVALAAATSSSAAIPIAVPTCAVVLMIPAAVPRQVASTSVPSVVAATDDNPIPAPPRTMSSGSAHAASATTDSKASEIAIRVRPAATT